MTKPINQMTPPEILAAVRDKDLKVIKSLVTDGVKNRKIWSVEDVVELTGVPQRTVYSWINK